MVPYERVVQWLAGPVAILSGWLATQIEAHWHIFGKLGIGHSQVGQAIFYTVIFVIGALVSIAPHFPWLRNLPKWWAHVQPGLAATDRPTLGAMLAAYETPAKWHPDSALAAEPAPPPEPSPEPATSTEQADAGV